MKTRRGGMKNKKTLTWYECKRKPGRECVYDGVYSSELPFKARSPSLEVNARTYRWNAENSKECKGCSVHIEESVFHLIVECMGNESEKMALLNVLKAVFGNDFFF